MPRLFVLVLLLLLVATACGDTRPAPPDGSGRAVVANVVDGDTIDVDVGGRTERIRLIGIDTPETVDPDRPVECYGPEASALIAELLPVGTEVRLEVDVEPRDRFGRLLAYVYRAADDLFVNEAMAAAGAAETLNIPPNTAYREIVGDAVARAQAEGRGLWGACPRQ